MEFTLLSELLAFINDKYTANGGEDGELISAAELLKGVRGLKEFIQWRGLKVLESTGNFSTTSGEDAGLAIVKNNGIYLYTLSGTADGIETFAAQTTGYYTLISRFPPKTYNGTFNLGVEHAVLIPAGYSINKILFSCAATNNINIGLSSGGSEIEAGLTIYGSEPYPFLRPLWYLTATPIYFNAATSQVNFKILFD